MQAFFTDILAELTADKIVHVRLGTMLAVLVVSLVSGYLAATRFGVPERYAKTIMTIVLVSFNWLIALLAIWRVQLSSRFIWLVIAGVVLLLSVTALSTVIFSLFKIDSARRLTLILAGSLSNLGYTGGAFICYGLFGIAGLALANIYIILWVPVAFFVFLPLLKVHELKAKGLDARFSLNYIIDFRCIALPAVIVAVILNLSHVEFPAFISKFYIIDVLVYVASAMAFFSVGLQVKLSDLKNRLNLYLIVSVIKFVLTPAIAVLFIFILYLAGINLPELVKKVIIVMSVTPSAVLMVTMSNVFDLDTTLASSVWIFTTSVFVILIVPILIFVFT